MARKAVQSPPAKTPKKSPSGTATTAPAKAVRASSAKVKAVAPTKAADKPTATKAKAPRSIAYNPRGKMEDGSPHPIDIHVGSRVRLRRSMVKMSQQQLASAVGITFQQVQKYERGINRISISRMCEMANALGVSPSYFLEDVPQQLVGTSKNEGFAEEAQAVFDADPLHRRETRALIRAYFTITDPKLRKQLLDLAKMLAQTSGKED